MPFSRRQWPHLKWRVPLQFARPKRFYHLKVFHLFYAIQAKSRVKLLPSALLVLHIKYYIFELIPILLSFVKIPSMTFLYDTLDLRVHNTIEAYYILLWLRTPMNPNIFYAHTNHLVFLLNPYN